MDKFPTYKDVEVPSLNNELDNIIDVKLDILSSNLSEWKKLSLEIIDRISKVEFTLADIYEYEYIFKKQFPENNTVRDSIRRNLQELRDLGLIRFLGNGKYLKLWKNKK